MQVNRWPFAMVLSIFLGDTITVQAQTPHPDKASSETSVVIGYEDRKSNKRRILWNSPPLNEPALMASPWVLLAKVQSVVKAFIASTNADLTGR